MKWVSLKPASVLRRIGSLLVGAGLLVGLTTMGATQQVSAFTPPTKPITDWSYYVKTTSTTTLYDLGCNQGKTDAKYGTDSLAFLDFGGQISGGTELTNDTTDVTFSQIELLAYWFADGYYYCTGPNDPTTVLTLAVGTSDSLGVSNSYGVDWANTVKATISQTSSFASQVLIWGGSDMEPGFNTGWSNTYNWIQGYASVDPALYLNYGSADKCPSAPTYDNGACADGWNQYDVWYASWGASPAVVSPQIYSANDASQWTMISEYGYQDQGGSAINFEGPLDEYDKDTSTLTSTQAWDDFTTDLNAWGLPYDPPYSLEVHDAT